MSEAAMPLPRGSRKAGPRVQMAGGGEIRLGPQDDALIVSGARKAHAFLDEPAPQSQAARASDGRASTSSWTRLNSKCATVTISRTSSGGCMGKMSPIGGLRSGVPKSGKLAPGELEVAALSPLDPSSLIGSAVAPIGTMIEASFNRLRREQMLIT